MCLFSKRPIGRNRLHIVLLTFGTTVNMCLNKHPLHLHLSIDYDVILYIRFSVFFSCVIRVFTSEVFINSYIQFK